jgi:O-antigen/teichoic acid export membrane protein
LVSFNIGSGVLFFLAKGDADKGRFIGIATSAVIVIGLSLALFLVWAWYVGVPVNPLFPAGINGFPFIAYVIGTVFFGLTHSLFHSIFSGLREFRVVNQMALISAAVMAVVFGGLFLVLHGDVGSDNLMIVLVASFFILLFLNALWAMYYVVVIKIRPVLFRGRALLKPLLSFILIGYLANLLNLLNYRFDVWYVQELLGAGELGIYAVAVGVAQFFFQVPDPISRVLQPHLIGQFDQRMLDKFRLFARLSFTLVLIGGAFIMLISNWLFPFLYGEAFTDSSIALRWLMPGILFACASKMMALLVIRTGKVGYNAIASGVGLAFTISMNIIFVPRFGIVGAAIASSIAYFAVLLVVLWFVFRRLNVPFGNYFILLPGDLSRLRDR